MKRSAPGITKSGRAEAYGGMQEFVDARKALAIPKEVEDISEELVTPDQPSATGLSNSIEATAY